MRRLVWTLTPEEFVSELLLWRTIWKRRACGSGPAERKRRVREVLRRRVRWYKAATGTFELPKAARAADFQPVWNEPNLDQIKIVIVPGTETGGSERALSSPRKQLRRSLRAATGEPVELLASRRTRRRLPAIGQTFRDGRMRSRGLLLEAIGAAIVPELSKTEAAALEAQGAVVLDNEVIGFIDPPAGDAPVPGLALWHLEAVGAPAAHAKGLTGKGALIGILDTGIDPTHPEFSEKNIYFQAFKENGERKPLTAPKDFDWHGTHVAAICAGSKMGVAPDADLAVAAVLTKKTPDGRMVGYTSQILAGMNWLARGDALPRGVDIINASLGSRKNEPGYYLTVSGHRLRGVFLVAAIGNDGEAGIGHHSVPAMFDCVMAVGAVDSSSKVASFSAWGPCFSQPASPAFKPDVMAPGVAITSAIPGARYAAKNGTSMACPIVAGAAALLIQQDEALRGDPDALAARIESLTRALPTQPPGYDVRRGGRGCLDLNAV